MMASPDVVQLGRAQNSPQDFFLAHNHARASVKVGPLRWNNTLATFAHQYAAKRMKDCSEVPSGGPYGENLFAGTTREWTAVEAVSSWVKEKHWYHYETNSCTMGEVCTHYTQVVWRNSVDFGCAHVKCHSRGVFIICNYNPPGNVVGEHPY
jgi:pathogenesis-related protein 1